MYLKSRLPELEVQEVPAGGVSADPFSLDSLIAWLRTKPADGVYCFTNWNSCLWGQYTKEMGGEVGYRFYRIGETRIGTLLSPNQWRGPISCGDEKDPNEVRWTFGAALTRALSLREGK